MADSPLEDLLARLERERQDADRLYNDALTAVDRAVQPPAVWPAAPHVADTTRLADINQRWNILPEPPDPGDRSLKGRLRMFIWRLIGPPLEAQAAFNASIVDHSNKTAASNRETDEAVSALVEGARREFEALARFESLLVQYLQTITVYVDTKDRSAAGGDLQPRLAMAEQRILTLKREVERLAATTTSGEAPGVHAPGSDAARSTPVFSGSVDSVTYVGFEDRFRGSEADIRARVEDYLPLFATASDVLDVGCGRGELLGALKAHGISARGVDTNAAMVDLCRSRGLSVERGDGLSYLEAQTDGSIGGLVAIQVVEHFEPAYLAKFLETAYHKMRAGAPLVLETINPACWMAFFETYIRDLTHQRPLHPDTLRYLVEASGFSSVDVQFRQPVTEGDRLERVKIAGDAAGALPRNLAQVADALNAHADKLNARLFSSMDYAVIARR